MTESSAITTALHQRATHLKLYGLLSQWETLDPEHDHWVASLIEWEEQERNRRGLERRMRNAHLGPFKPLADFEWDWPQEIDRGLVTELMQLQFVPDAHNLVLLGTNGVGKTTIAKNIVHQAVLKGHSALCTTAADMLNLLDAQDGNLSLQRRLKYFAQPELLLIDEVGYLSYANRHADLLFDIINRRYENKATIVTTNRPFSEWNEVFPNAACVVSLVDRLVHHAQIIAIKGESYRMKEAQENAAKQQSKKSPTAKRKSKTSTTKEDKGS